MLVNYLFWNFLVRDGEEWHRMRKTIGPKIMRPKIVEENINNFNAVSKDAVTRFIKLKESSQEADGHIPDLEKEMKRWALEGNISLNLFQLFTISYKCARELIPCLYRLKLRKPKK